MYYLTYHPDGGELLPCIGYTEMGIGPMTCWLIPRTSLVEPAPQGIAPRWHKVVPINKTEVSLDVARDCLNIMDSRKAVSQPVPPDPTGEWFATYFILNWRSPNFIPSMTSPSAPPA